MLTPTPAISKSVIEILLFAEYFSYRSWAADSARMQRSIMCTGTKAAVRIAKAGIETSGIRGRGGVSVLRISRRSSSDGAYVRLSL